jgi:uncharacterized membrane protein
LSILSGLILSAEENCVNSVRCLCHALSIPVTNTTIKKQLKDHPNFPSLLSISDTLNSWKVENITINASDTYLENLPIPFITQLKSSTTNFVVVRGIAEQHIEYSDPTLEKWIKATKNDFLNQWTGKVMCVDPLENAGEPEYKKKKKEQVFRKGIKIALTAAIIIIFLFSIRTSFTILSTKAIGVVVLLVLKLLGLYITSILLYNDIDHHNPVIQNVCSTGKKTDCNYILQSKGAKINDYISWSEVGFAYFTGGAITLLLFNHNEEAFRILAWLNIFALPYTIYSVLYQWRIAKQWCVLCLTIQAILVAEFLTTISCGIELVSPVRLEEFHNLWIVSFTFIIPVLVWWILKPILLLSVEAHKSTAEYNRLKYSHKIFMALLNNQEEFQYDPAGLGITLGNPAASNRLIKVCNPYCSPCARAHPALEELLSTNENIALQIIFTATNDPSDKRAQPVRHFLSLAEEGHSELISKSLDHWYNNSANNYEEFAEAFKLTGDVDLQNTKIESMNEWCTKMKITRTPTFFLNGRELPREYTIKDLKYIL